jgi:hypothetical protein
MALKYCMEVEVLDKVPVWRLKDEDIVQVLLSKWMFKFIASFITHQMEYHNLLFIYYRCYICISYQDLLFNFIVAFINYDGF